MTSINKYKNITDSLLSSGVTRPEASLYIASLGLGEAGMTELSKKADLKRTSAYVLFQSLEKKGFMGSFKTRHGMRYVAKDPSYILNKAKKEVETLQSIMPELEAIKDVKKKKPKITYYEGVSAYIDAVEESLKKPNITLRHIGSLSEGHKALSEKYDFEYFMPERIKKNIFLRGIYTPEVAPKFKKENDTGMLRQIKFLPNNHPIKTLTLIFEDKVIISTTKEHLVTVVIESQEIADAERSKFDLLWSVL